MDEPPPISERRLDTRRPVSERVTLVGLPQQVFEAEVVDRSLRGLRIRLERAASLPREVTVLCRASGAVQIARVVWRTAPYAGLAISKTVELRNASGPEAAELRRMWREHIAG